MASAPGGFTPDRRGLEQLALAAPVRAALTAEGARAEAIAEQLSQEFTDTGDYLRSFEIREDETTVGGRHPHKAAAVELRNTSPHAAAVEYGHEGRAGRPGQSAHHVLARTLDAMDRT